MSRSQILVPFLGLLSFSLYDLFNFDVIIFGILYSIVLFLM